MESKAIRQRVAFFIFDLGLAFPKGQMFAKRLLS
jgi:hypothetical protein